MLRFRDDLALERFWAWHLSNRRDRLSILETDIRDRIDPSWRADRSLQSLLTVAQWLGETYRLRAPRNEAEWATCRESVVDLQEIQDEATWSRAHDAGLYFGDCLIAVRPGLTWVQLVDDPLMADWGQAVVTGFLSGVTFNPIRIILVVLAKFRFDGIDTKKEVARGFAVWKAQG